MSSGDNLKWVGLFTAIIIIAAVGGGIVFFDFGTPSPADEADRLYQEALAADEAGDLEAMRQRIFSLRFIDGQERRVDLLQGKLDLKRGLLDDAIRELTSAAEDPANRQQAMTLLGEACYRSGQHALAQQVLMDVLQTDSSQVEARRWLAASLYDIGAMQLALNELQILADQVPEDGRPSRLRALIHKDFELYTDAIQDYQESLRRDPDAPDRDEMLLELAECQLRQHLYEEALQTAEKAKPGAAGLVIRGECERALGRQTEAVRNVDEALRLDPDFVPGLLLRARLLDDQDEPSAALKVLQQAVQIDPQQYDVRFELSNILNRLGQEAEAEAQAAEAQRLQQLRLEFTKLHEAAFTDTQNADLRFQLGQTAQQLGKPELARTWFQAALAIDPQHTASQAALSELPEPPAD